MRKPMSKNLEKLMHHANSNEEIRQLYDAHESIRKELAESLDQSKRLLEHLFKSLALKRKYFEISHSASNEKMYVYKEVLLKKFDDNILLLSWRNDFTKTKYPKCF